MGERNSASRRLEIFQKICSDSLSLRRHSSACLANKDPNSWVFYEYTLPPGVFKEPSKPLTVLNAHLWVTEALVGLLEQLKVVGSLRVVWVFIGMPFYGCSAISLFDFFGSGREGYPQDSIVTLS